MEKNNPQVEVSLLIRASQEKVFTAFTNPEMTTKFWFTKSSGKLEKGKQLEWTWEMYNHTVNVKVLSLVPNEKIIIQWGADQNSTVEWNFKKISPERTFVIIVNRGFSGTCEEVIAQTNDATGGFTLVLAGLKAYLEHGIALNLIADKMPA